MDGANDVTEYTYDANGNLKKDYNKKIVDIRYNSLNLPDGLQFTNGNTTMYTYDAAGNKLGVTHQTAVAGITIPMSSVMITLTPEQIYSSFKTDYCGNMIYENGELSKILTEEGYITFSGSTPVYHYYLRDHQGNNRVVLNQSGTVEQLNHYYPFGGLFGESTNVETQPYKYNGKEFDGMYGLNLFDYGAHHYDAAIGRWMNMDPLSEGYYNISPYAYVGNNPVRFIDPDGREPRIYVETKGFGHAFVTVGTGDNTIVYTYGRYGELGKDKSSARGSTPTGEGILIRLTGSEAKQFIKDQMLTNEAVAFEFKNGSDELVTKHFEDKYNSSDKIPKVGKYANNENARVIDEYNIFSNNCVTTSVDGAQSGVKEKLNMENLVGPVALKESLNMKSNIPNSSVVKITYDEIKKDLKLSNGAVRSW